VRPDVSYGIPVRYVIIVIRGIILKGVGADVLRTELWAMAIIGAVTVTLAATSFKKRLD
jgi:ABC-2 type transport system permease protein